ncbi:MAG: bifunctional glutamate N-acetyltransferase/amino-acid acetyltransferase ArgJ [Acidobacteriales bacterium]|nr:bifunctional glutamate N-acetyltransferase/amino-acid acetyltransferase ArgJ [Terriglobales bacterium]
MNRLNLPLGFRYASTYAGIRKQRRDDVALIVADSPASAAAMFTTNRVKAAPVTVSMANLKASRGKVRAIVVNAGNANCATRTGKSVATATCRAAGEALGCPAIQVLGASTGVIGVELDGALLVKAMPKLVKGLSADRFDDAAQAIMTTDLAKKVAFAEARLKGGRVRIAGMTKGSGMIQPRMATTLGFVMTDAAAVPAVLQPLLREAVEQSYNRLSVDGDTSTNDTVALLASGASGVKVTPADRADFLAALERVLISLAEQIARDGEGASKFITIEVTGAANDVDATQIARSIANSPLVKTAIAGSDPNWGRILSAAGNAGVKLDPALCDVKLQGVTVCRRGLAADFDEPALTRKLDEKECSIRFCIRGKGRGKARFWTCDFTEGYIKINASYRT